MEAILKGGDWLAFDLIQIAQIFFMQKEVFVRYTGCNSSFDCNKGGKIVPPYPSWNSTDTSSISLSSFRLPCAMDTSYSDCLLTKCEKELRICFYNLTILHHIEWKRYENGKVVVFPHFRFAHSARKNVIFYMLSFSIKQIVQTYRPSLMPSRSSISYLTIMIHLRHIEMPNFLSFCIFIGCEVIWIEFFITTSWHFSVQTSIT